MVSNADEAIEDVCQGYNVVEVVKDDDVVVWKMVSVAYVGDDHVVVGVVASFGVGGGVGGVVGVVESGGTSFVSIKVFVILLNFLCYRVFIINIISQTFITIYIVIIIIIIIVVIIGVVDAVPSHVREVLSKFLTGFVIHVEH